jgi:beta-glucanase (GH16 family)
MHTRTIVALMSTAIAVGIVAAQTPVWSEEFNGDSLDTNVWSYDLGAGGWGNGELQTYREENAVVRDGNLLITVQREGSGGFSSARIKTENKLSFKYGIVQANISAPDVIAGLWPAFWTMGNDFAQVGWPAAGELDIMEIGQGLGIAEGVGNKRLVSAAHWEFNETRATYARTFDHPTDLNGTYHVYKMDWTPTRISTYVDDFMIWDMLIDPENCVDCEELHSPHFFLLNVAVGGGFTSGSSSSSSGGSSGIGSSSSGVGSSGCGGSSGSSGVNACGGLLTPEGITAPLPGTMAVDFIRIFGNDFTEINVPVQTASSDSPTTTPISSPTMAPQTVSPTTAPVPAATSTKSPSAEPVVAASTKAPSALPVAKSSTDAPTRAPVERLPTSSKSGKGSSSKSGGKSKSSKSGGKSSSSKSGGKSSSSKSGGKSSSSKSGGTGSTESSSDSESSTTSATRSENVFSSAQSASVSAALLVASVAWAFLL